MVLINAPKQDQWQRLLGGDGPGPTSPTDPRFSYAARAAEPRGADRDRGAARRLARDASVEDAYRALIAADVPAAPVRDIDQVAADPQVRAPSRWSRGSHPGQSGLEMQLTGNPVKMSGMTRPIGPPPEKGEHNRDVYGTWLGYDADRIAELAARKII